MERRAASHTEEEEMNQRRKLLNAARRGDTKAISKLFELYQVRVLSGDQLAKVNRTSTYMVPVKASQSGKSKSQEKGKKSAPGQAKGGKNQVKVAMPKPPVKTPAKTAHGKPPKVAKKLAKGRAKPK
ncbi:MAG: hypothetical protein CV090_04905 [Nitrospira sp. WS238]|nr:hypothetical protein [Nitrospira sp. WS238]